MLEQAKIGFIGGGAMGEALLSGILKAGLTAPQNIVVSEIEAARRQYLTEKYAVETIEEATAAAQRADILFLTVKPQVARQIMAAVGGATPAGTLVISVVAGLTLTSLEAQFRERRVIRAMPNTPVAVGEGMAALALGGGATGADGKLAAQLFGAVGKAVLLDESLLDAATGLSGSGPAYGFVLIDALADGGVRAGLPRRTAITLAAQTLLGAAKMVLETGEHPARLRDMVTSPGGTSIAGLQVLERRGVRSAMIDAVAAAAEHSRAMGAK